MNCLQLFKAYASQMALSSYTHINGERYFQGVSIDEFIRMSGVLHKKGRLFVTQSETCVYSPFTKLKPAAFLITSLIGVQSLNSQGNNLH